MDPELVVVAETPPPEPPAPDGETLVRVAEIEAERDIAIAQTNVEQTQILADAARAQEDEDLTWLRGELDGLRGRCETSEAELSSLRTTILAMQEMQSQMAEQMQTLIAAVAQSPPPAPPTPEPGSPPNPSDADGDGLATPPQDPPTPPAEPAKKRQRVWLR